MQFLPEDYESPKSTSGYMKIQDGENRIRILSAPIVGWEDWKDNKPIRFRMNQKPDKPVDEKKPIRHFWAFVIWDYAQQRVCVFEIVQASIRKRIEELSKDADWGAPYSYDIKIVRKGHKVETEYVVNPVSHKEIEPKIKEAFMSLPIELDQLFVGGDPFKGSERTIGFWEMPPAAEGSAQEPTIEPRFSLVELVSKEQATYIDMLIFQYISPVDPNWKYSALKAMKIDSFSKLEKRLYDLMVKRIEEKRQKISSEEIPF